MIEIVSFYSQQAPSERGLTVLFTAATFVGAGLLFLVQPLVARLALPLLGGTPAVWTTAMLFFQAVLLAGYLWAWWLARLRPTVAAVIHVTLVFGAALALPLGWPEAFAQPPEEAHAGWLLAALGACVGLPFFALSSAGPLLQSWLARARTRVGRDPYWLYGASNLGSMLALVAYPLVLEPQTTLSQQSWGWSVGFAVFAALLVAAAALFARRASAADTADIEDATGVDDTAEPRPEAPAVAPGQAMRWVFLAFVPSSAMLGVTAHISAEVAVIPLFWVAPLALYLGSFVIAFGRWGEPATRAAAWLLPPLLAAVAWMLGASARQPVFAQIAVHLAALIVIAVFCHGQLAARRPDPARLTTFYVMLSVGGALGGLFNSLLAPVAFPDLWEYPIVLVCAALARVPRGIGAPADEDARLVETPARHWLRTRGAVVVPGAVLAAVLLLPLSWDVLDVSTGGWSVAAYALARLGPATLVTLAATPWRIPFAVALTALLVSPSLLGPDKDDVRYRSRSFFGVHRVIAEERGDRPWHKLMHGVTKHGVQCRDADRAMVPTSYYHPSGPVGDVLRALDANVTGRDQHIAVVGLGGGAFLSHGRADRQMTLFEIDPEVVQVARDPALFTYLRDTPSPWTVVLGDARLSLAHTPEGTAYDLILLDAFRGDAMPAHLMTREAVQTYVSRLAPGGVLAVHISSWYVDLRPLLASLAEDLDLAALVRTDAGLTARERKEHKSASRWAVLTRPDAPLRATLAETKSWAAPSPRPGFRVWTDDYSGVLTLFR